MPDQPRSELLHLDLLELARVGKLALDCPPRLSEARTAAELQADGAPPLAIRSARRRGA